MTTPWIVLILAVAALSLVTALLVLGLLRRLSVALQNIELLLATNPAIGGVATGTHIPAFAVRDELGVEVESSRLLSGIGLYLFLSAGCEPCDSLLKQVIAKKAKLPAEVPLIVITDGEKDAHLATSAGLSAFRDRTGFRRLNILRTPFVIAVDEEERVVASEVPDSVDRLLDLQDRLAEGVVARA